MVQPFFIFLFYWIVVETWHAASLQNGNEQMKHHGTPYKRNALRLFISHNSTNYNDIIRTFAKQIQPL